TGAIAMLSSNFFLGQGPWTPWQMLLWGACGVAGAALAPLLRHRIPFAAVCFVLGFVVSALMDVQLWVSYWPHTWGALTVVVGQPGGKSDLSLTAWATLGLVSVGREPDHSSGAYLTGQQIRTANDLALRILALRALGEDATPDLQRLEGLRRPDGRIGTLVNS